MQQNMNTSVKTFQILQEYLKDLEKEKTTIQTTYYKIKNLNTTLIAKIKNYREKIDTYNNRISFIKLLNHCSIFYNFTPPTNIELFKQYFRNYVKKLVNIITQTITLFDVYINVLPGYHYQQVIPIQGGSRNKSKNKKKNKQKNTIHKTKKNF